jgi:hypothetical protein
VKVLPPSLRAVTPAELAERLRAERRGTPFLVYLDGGRRQQLVDLGERTGPVAIGRQAANDVALEHDTEVSRVHAVLEPVGGEWTVVDDGLSRNGTYVNGRRVHARRRLEDGDTLAVGRTLMVFVAPDHPAAPTTTSTTRNATPPELSAAQRRVLVALCRPFFDDPFAGPPSNREIADALFVSVETVKSHLHALFESFGVGNMPQNRKRSELVRRAFERGVVTGAE